MTRDRLDNGPLGCTRPDVVTDLALNMTHDIGKASYRGRTRLTGVRRWLAKLVLALVLILPLAAQPASCELLRQIDLFMDDTEALDIASVTTASFKPVERTMVLGYTASAAWLRLRIDPAPDGGEVVVIVRPPMLDGVEFYAPTPAARDDAAARPGPSYHLLEPDWPSSLRGFRITPPKEGGVYYVRITSTGSVAATITASPARKATRINLVTDLVQISYFTFMVVLLIWALRMLRLTREHLLGWFVAMQSAWLFHNIIAFGYAAVLKPVVEQSTLTLVFRASVVVASFLSAAFHRAVLIRFRPATWAVGLFDLQLAGIFIALILFLTYDRQFALQLNAYCLTISPFSMFLNALTARHDASPGLKTTRAIYALLSALLLIWILSLLGHVKISILSLYGFMIHGLATGILMVTILHLHIRNLFIAAKETEAQIARMERQRAIQQEKNRTLAQFLDMLTHEARNALAVINMSISQPTLNDRRRNRISEAILGLTGVIERCNQTLRLDSEDQVVHLKRLDLADTLRRLCNGHGDVTQLCLRAEGPLFVQSDPVLLGVIFGNLIDNAQKYSPPNSRVMVEVTPCPEGVSVLFENEQGQYGAPDPAFTFQKYYRNELARAKIGSGLGLYIVRSLLTSIGGRIAYEPSQDRIRFRIWLPC